VEPAKRSRSRRFSIVPPISGVPSARIAIDAPAVFIHGVIDLMFAA
jgi:hypothetical protein